MISKDLSRKIYNCHSELEKCDELIKKMSEAIDKTGEPKLLDAFGERKGLQLGIPCGDNGHKLLNVSPQMAIKVIQEHKDFNQSELKRLNGLALIQAEA